MSAPLPNPASGAEAGAATAVIGSPAGIRFFFASRWRGEAPLATVFWRDMILWGTAINIAAAFTALMLLAAGFSTPVVLGAFFSPLPWNLFLVFSVWRSGDNAPASNAAMTRCVAALWFAMVLII